METLKAYCVSPSCAFVAMEGESQCISCLGLAPKSKRGFTVWNNESFCEDCNKVVKVELGEQFTTEQEWKGIAVYCPIHKIQL